MEERAGGSGARSATGSGERVIGHSLLFRKMETLGLQVEHGAVAAIQGHEFIMRSQLHHPALFEHADAIGLADGGKTMRDKYGRGTSGRRKQPIEDFHLAAHVELSSRLIQQN